jgi:hypothetical protein
MKVHHLGPLCASPVSSHLSHRDNCSGYSTPLRPRLQLHLSTLIQEPLLNLGQLSCPAVRESIVFSTSLLLEFCDVAVELVEVLSLLGELLL